MQDFPIFTVLVVVVLSLALSKIIRQHKRKKYIESYQFPNRIRRQLRDVYPHLSEADIDDIQEALKDYFRICGQAGRKLVAMPSQAVDLAWHEFILFTREYKSFCQKALGRFLHHTPAEAMQSQKKAQTSIKRAWRIACLNEKINPKSPTALPRLFSIDANKKIPNGFFYSLNCSGQKPDNYCASGIGCSSCGGGCSGGDGCGGGCGGD